MVREIRELESCIGGVTVREVVLAEAVDEPLVRRLARDARLDWHPELPRPYFRIERPHAWTLQGVVGRTSLRATLEPTAPPDAMERLRAALDELTSPAA